jgi:hypothetical protein
MLMRQPRNSANCRLASRDCEYQDFNIPLRERRVRAKHGLPALSQDVWPIIMSSSSCLPTGSFSSSARSAGSPPTTSSGLQTTLTRQIDPFETLAIAMPLKSKQLMRYCESSSRLRPPRRVLTLSVYHSADAFDIVFKEPQDDRFVPSSYGDCHRPCSLPICLACFRLSMTLPRFATLSFSRACTTPGTLASSLNFEQRICFIRWRLSSM